MALAEPEELTYPMPMESTFDLFNPAPDFIDSGHGPTRCSATSVLRQCDELKRQIKIEEAILKRVPDHAKPAQLVRVEALYAMVLEGLTYAQSLRQLDRPSEPFTWNGYAVGDRVLIRETGGVHGTVMGFAPAYEPTHAVVQLDTGRTTPYRDHQIAPAKDS